MSIRTDSANRATQQPTPPSAGRISIAGWAQARGMGTWITETGGSKLMPASRPAELLRVVEAARRAGVERVYWYSVEDVDWRAQREINLD